jgi:high-affinity iron transporter
MAGVTRSRRKDYLRAIPVGGAVGFLATVATWFVVVAVISRIDAPALSVQAGTGLLAIVVLLVVMNWFFHKVYWTGWITNLSGQRKRLLEAAGNAGPRTFLGLALLGFAAIYREGFEIVLFLQDLRLKAGTGVILEGAAIGLGLTLIVAALTFAGHKRLPYKKMLVVTGVLLAVVLLVMVGEEAQEMQLAGWIGTTTVPIPIPDWLGTWFAVFPTAQTLTAQAIAGLLVIGSYVWARRSRLAPPRTAREVEAA